MIYLTNICKLDRTFFMAGADKFPVLFRLEPGQRITVPPCHYVSVLDEGHAKPRFQRLSIPWLEFVND